MGHVILGRLAALALLLAVFALSGSAAAQAQGSGEGLIPVCVQGFESTPGVQYLTQAQIDEIEATGAAYDQSDIPPPQVTGYPDPATGSCATENGVPVDFDPEFFTLVCVGSGPGGDGPLVPQLAINHYLGNADDVILADPATGACSQQAPANGGTYGLLILARNCADELTVFFTRPQAGCVPGDGAFFNVYADSGVFLGNCEAASAHPSTSIFAGCTVQVPYGSTGVVTEDLASIPNYAPGANPVPFTAPGSGTVDGEDYGPIFINVLQTGADDGSLATNLPNTGVGREANESTGGMTAMLLVGAATVLSLAGLRVRHQAYPSTL